MTRSAKLLKVPEVLVGLGLVAAPFILGLIGATPDMLSRVLIWGLFGIGFHLLFGVTGLLSFGQTIFYGTGGFLSAYLLIHGYVDSVYIAVLIGTVGAIASSLVVGMACVKRSGIYFAMATFAFAEFAFFLEFSPLRSFTGGEDGLSGVPQPSYLNNSFVMYAVLAVIFLVGFAIARHIKRSSFGLILRGIKRNSLRTAAVGHNIWLYSLAVFCISSAYGGFAGGLLGIFQTYMPPDAFAVHSSVQLVVQTVIGGVGSLIGPLVGAFVWIYLRTVLQLIPGIGALWQVLLAFVFVACVLFLREGIVGAVRQLFSLGLKRFLGTTSAPADSLSTRGALPGHHQPAGTPPASPGPTSQRRDPCLAAPQGDVVLQLRSVTKRYGGLLAVDKVSFDVRAGSLLALIGPNGAGKTTLFSMLSGGLKPTAGTIKFKDNLISGLGATRTCQLGVSKSYQITQLFDDMTVRDNLTIPVLARRYGSAALRSLLERPRLQSVQVHVEKTMHQVDLLAVADTNINELPYGDRRRLEIGLALASSPALILLDEPLAGLSPSERQDIKRLIVQISHETNVLLVEHDMDAVFELADRVIVMQNGEIIFDGSPNEMRGNSAVRKAYLGRRALADSPESLVHEGVS